MALDPRIYRGLTPDGPAFLSSASAPSLRASEPEVQNGAAAMPDPEGGNVKVVVRVRAFVKRGIVDPTSNYGTGGAGIDSEQNRIAVQTA